VKERPYLAWGRPHGFVSPPSAAVPRGRGCLRIQLRCAPSASYKTKAIGTFAQPLDLHFAPSHQSHATVLGRTTDRFPRHRRLSRPILRLTYTGPVRNARSRQNLTNRHRCTPQIGSCGLQGQANREPLGCQRHYD
jgi:hypothetical protein